MSDTRRHLELFGPDLARGPVLSGSPQTAAVQIAAAIAQLRAPLKRSDDDIRAHADFIRELAERLFPDWATQIVSTVGALSGRSIATTILAPTGGNSLLTCWLADTTGGGLTSTAPDTVTWNSGVVVQEVVTKKLYLVVTPDTGTAQVTVTHNPSRNYRWALARTGRVYYSSLLVFP